MDKIRSFLKAHNIVNSSEIIYNPTYEQLLEAETHIDNQNNEKATLTNLGVLSVNTGKFTGRLPKDKYIVKDETTADTVWWYGSGKSSNQPITQSTWSHLKDISTHQLSNKKLYIIDAISGANSKYSLKVRFITEVAWQAHFIKNMFIPLKPEDSDRDIDFTVINASKVVNTKWQEHGFNSENFVAFNFTTKVQLIGGTWYAGEMKKGLFNVMNYLLPQINIPSLHASGNVASGNKNVSLFFGLSGTGKTSLATDSKHQLVGDDQQGWDDEGIFNIEGGCYAKVAHLTKEAEPDIYNAIKNHALLENVVIKDGKVDFNDTSKTENTRVSYPISYINNIVKPVSKAGHAKNIIFLTADAFGVLPAVSKLTLAQAEYYFLSGYTSKMAGSELGIQEPTPTFSPCFGATFLIFHPTVYTNLLLKKIKEHNSNIYLINTGWNGHGTRISIQNTRIIVNSILDGTINNSNFNNLPLFNLQFPATLPGLESNILDPRRSYANDEAWNKKAVTLTNLFVNNFKYFVDTSHSKDLEKIGPKI